MEQRGPDRRRFSRGGRRTEDASGHTPLVLLVDPDQHRRTVAESLLTQRQFAVAPAATIEEALAVGRGLVPEVGLCPPSDLQTLRTHVPFNTIPLVAVSDSMARSDQLIEVVRTALRLQRVHR